MDSTDCSTPVCGCPYGVPGPNMTPLAALADMVVGLSETRRRSVSALARTRSSSRSGKSAFSATSPSIASASRQLEVSPSDTSARYSRLALARIWLPRNSISSEICPDERFAVPSGSIEAVRLTSPALSAGSSAEPERTTSPKATVGIPRRSTCSTFRPLSSRALFGVGGSKDG